jgi:uncharacterized protein (TIGR03437 family)
VSLIGLERNFAMRFLKLACVASTVLGCALAQPSVATNGVINNASYAVGQAVAPGSVVSIFGSGLAAATLGFDSVPLSVALGSPAVEVFFNDDDPAPLYFVSSGQINAQLPWDLPTSGTVSITVKNGSVTSASMPVPMAPAAPGIYSIPSGVGYAVAFNNVFNGNTDAALAAPTNANLGYPSHPAKAGDVLTVYATGLGPVGLSASGPPSPPAPGAASLDATRYTLSTPALLVGGTPAQVIFSGLTPQFVGINQINFIVPPGITGNSVPLQLVEGGITSTDQVVIAIQ